jgi:hypothetical protein
MERALKCPQCQAPLPVARFARSVVCPFCGSTVLLDEHAVAAQRFHAAFAAWDTPAAGAGGVAGGARGSASIVDTHWELGRLVAHGETADVYAARRARWPTTMGLLKVLRDRRDAAGFDHEWDMLMRIQGSAVSGASRLPERLPQPVRRGEITAGEHAGARGMVLRWAPGYMHTFEDVRRVHRDGIEARASIWVWRRILELLAFLHAAGYVHGAVVPPHLLVEDGEHGVRLVGFRRAGRAGAAVQAPPVAGYESLWPARSAGAAGAAKSVTGGLTPALDLAMSARCVAWLLGGDAATGEVPDAIPSRLAEQIRRTAMIGGSGGSAGGGAGEPAGDDAAANGAGAAWTLRERLGELAREIYGPPAFCPITMPEET